MDIKTLQYLEERAAKGRAIVNKIETMLNAVERAKKARNIEIYTASGGSIFITELNKAGELPNDPRTHLSALMVNVFIDNTLHQVRDLEAELAAL
ncbi:hypothetical protein [Cohnella yongneupensis]|uniref:Uncharacterized protein n=1 Tax=Cohnella yongneupensis TaxID=425006 RepID=A0ABW0QXV7_9BACL